jgi:hypothetical protein
LTISSIQDGKNGKPEWILSGGWDLRNINSSSPAFNAGFNMVTLNGSASHTHAITDFKMTGIPITKGTAAILLKKGPVKGVPISIKLIGTSVVNLWIDPAKTEGHFGNTPIYGVQSGIRYGASLKCTCRTLFPPVSTNFSSNLEIDGFSLYEKIKKLDDKVAICFLTAADDAYYKTSKKKHPSINENCVIHKPVDNESLLFSCSSTTSESATRGATRSEATRDSGRIRSK